MVMYYNETGSVTATRDAGFNPGTITTTTGG